MAYEDATGALEKRDANRFWYSMQGLLAACTHLRRLLWPEEPCAAELREVLGLDDHSPLRQAALSAESSVPGALGPWNAGTAAHGPLVSNLGPGEPRECIRCFDPETGTFTLFGTVFELSPLLTAIAELGNRAEVESQHLREVV